MKQKIFINFAEARHTESLSYYYIHSYRDLYENLWIKTYVVFIGNTEEKLQEEFLTIIWKKDVKELEIYLQEIAQDYEIVFLNTFSESLILETNRLRKILGHKVSEFPEIFRNKHLQRKYLQEYDVSLGIRYQEIELENIDRIHIRYPFIIKPSSWVQSAWVSIMRDSHDLQKYKESHQLFEKNFQKRGYQNSLFLIEEFIDGDMYSIDYFVSKEGNIIFSDPVEVSLGTELWIKDFMNYCRCFSKEAKYKKEKQELEIYFHKCVKALKIKSIFIHHEFKITSKWEIKTIEVNGRIGGYRLEMIQEAYNFNWLRASLWEKLETGIVANFSVFLLYPPKRGILRWFQEELFSQIKKKKSFFHIKLLEKYIWKEIGLTWEWFEKVGIIKLKNIENKDFLEDNIFIKEHFKELLVLE